MNNNESFSWIVNQLKRKFHINLKYLSLGLSSILFAFQVTAFAVPVTADNLPVINQNNPAYDHNPNDGNQNGKQWCVPVATVSALQWLAEKYDRPKLIPVYNSGKKYTTDEFVAYLGNIWFSTDDILGTNENKWVRFLWGYLQTTPYQWNMNVYAAAANPPIVNPIDGPTFFGHATVDDIYQEMKSAEDSPAAAVLLAYQSTDAFGKVTKHAEVMQQLNDEKDLQKRYPGKVMNPEVGRIDDVQFDATNGFDAPANMYDGIVWRDIYLAIAISPIPEPTSITLFALGLIGLRHKLS